MKTRKKDPASASDVTDTATPARIPEPAANPAATHAPSADGLSLEARFHAIVSLTPDHILVQDKDLRYVMVINPQLGLTEAGMVGKTDADILAKGDAEKITHIKRKVLESGQPFPLVTSLKNVKGETEFFEGAYVPRYGADGKPEGLIGYFRNVTAKTQIENALRESESKYRKLFSSMTEGFALHELLFDKHGLPCDYRFLTVNPAFERLTGLKAKALVGKSQRQVLPDEAPFWLEAYSKVALTGESIHIENYSAPLRRHFGVFAYCPAPNQFATIFSDITERKQTEALREMNLKVMQILNEPDDDLAEVMQRVLALLKEQTDFDAVGLRLQDGEDFPYFVQQGFPADFLLTENSLAARRPDGGVCRDKNGKACLECMCGLVISGKTNPAHPLFTRGGSFWTNDAAQLLDLPPDQDPRYHPRNACIHHGYASVALIPVRDKERIFGLLQLNARRKGCLTLAAVKILEDFAAHIGESLSRRRGEEKLKRSDEQFRTLAEVAPVGIYLCDPDGHCVFANPAWCGMAGLSAAEALGKGWAAGLHPEDRDRVCASWRQMVKSHGQWGLEYRFQTREGKVTWVYGLATPQFDDSGKIVQYVGINIDITVRKLTDDVQTFLAQTSSGGTKELFFGALARYLAQSLGMDFVCIDRLEGDGLNARTLAVWCDGRFEDNVTYALKDTPCGDLVGKQVCCFPASVCQFFPRDQVLKDLRAESYIGVTLFGHTGKPIGLIAVIGRGPLENRPLAEAVLKLVAVRAAGEVERQDAELELQKMQMLRSIGMLAGGIAHDFNNILLGLFGNISIAMDDLSKEHPSYAPLEDAEKSMTRAVRLTKQLLTFAKGGAPVKEYVSLGAMAEEVARFDLTGSSVRLVYHHDADLWPVDADKGQIQQVISNLVINARQAMPKGGKLTVTLENADLPEASVPTLSAGKYVKVSVQDEGDGINPEEIVHIFDPYFTTKQSGNGLGLATVWSIINRHGGYISVVSELGKGTTFTFYLPASESARPEENKPAAAECLPLSRPAKILVMDDEEAICTLAAKMLLRCGYSVATASDSHEAIALCKEALKSGAPFDLVIMDLTIPGGPGGKEVIKDLLALDPRVHAIVSSGYADDPVMADPAAYGFKGTVSKPYTASALREAVARVLAC